MHTGRLALAFAFWVAACTDAEPPAGEETGTGSTGGDETTGTGDPCASVVCEAWEVCEAGVCGLAAGRCIEASDCDGELLCDDDHQCVTACDLLDCPAEATCEEEGGMAWCVCGGGLFANGGQCVEEILFALPMDNPDGTLINGVIGFDNDAEPGSSALDCVNYAGEPFPACYDDHRGSDFILLGGFTQMDRGSAAVLAAADGVVVDTHDGEFDRCALNLSTQQVECEDGGPVTPSNRIEVEHADGGRTHYLHLKEDSITVAIGDRVTCGQPMALVGSSGNSSLPHLHFTVELPDGTRIDPYAGPFSSENTRWVKQDGVFELPSPNCQ